MWRLAKTAGAVAVAVISAVAGVAFAFFGLLGLSGGLTDTSERENVETGIVFLLMAGGAVLFFLGAVATLRDRDPGPPGRCRRCGYDLRATPARCPECGTRAVASQD